MNDLVAISRVLVLAAQALALAAPAPAAAGVVTFDGAEIVTTGAILNPQSPRFVEDGLHVEAFWASGIGGPRGRFIVGHFHPPDLATGYESQHFGWQNELHGIYLRRADGQPFSLRSVDFRITLNKNLPGRNKSIKGFAVDDVHLLIAVTFDPTKPVSPQFLRFPVGVGVDNDPERPFRRMRFVELESVTQVFIASSTSVDIDNIATAP